MDPQPERLALVEQPEPLSIAALYRQVQAAVNASFPRGQLQWVRGEIQSISDRTGHCYMDLVDPDATRGRDTPVLKVNCWGRTWNPLKLTLGRQGVVLEPGVVVSLRGRVEFYPPKGQINFIATEVDVTALLGRLAARRAALLNTLETEGLLRRNRVLVVPDVPLRVGLVASPGSEGYNDFVGQLQASELAFDVTLFKANVQGSGAPASVTRALKAVSVSDCDVAVLVRGGGSRGDLAAFDAEAVARAIATCPIPLWSGIGHTGDQSVADIVANQAFVTPTACAQELVRRVGAWWASVAQAGGRIAQGAIDALEMAAQRDAAVRRRLGTATRNQLSRHAERLETRKTRVTVQALRQLDFAGKGVERRAARLGPRALRVLDRQQDRADSWRRLLAAYDIERQLERGYTITLGPDGSVVRSVSELTAGSRLVTRFADGRASSTVDGTESRSTTEGQQ
ncbi:MAG TPA: exodeoxyribonuclease VII large subunit [Acidimicrobiales bacterium]|nr:exodeoxyribonuclease VII large subunit [Acidimicrobiales bacterium]